MRRWLPWAMLALGLTFVIWAFAKATTQPASSFAELPILTDGRLKPMDTLAQTSMAFLSGTRKLRVGDANLAPADWLARVFFDPEQADRLPTFYVTNPDLRDLLELPDGAPKRLSYELLLQKGDVLQEHFKAAAALEKNRRSAFHRECLVLAERLRLYARLRGTFPGVTSPELLGALSDPGSLSEGVLLARENREATDERGAAALAKIALIAGAVMKAATDLPPGVVPRTADTNSLVWMPAGEGLERTLVDGAPSATLLRYYEMADASRRGDAGLFEFVARKQVAALKALPGLPTWRLNCELFFARFNPFRVAAATYVFAFLCFCLAWVSGAREIRRGAVWLLGLALVVHTVGVVLRCILHGRPPVTNLYSSAIFVGWACVFFSLILESRSRTGLGGAAGAAIGTLCLLVAHFLGLDGDTIHVMQAVLDSNFWLSTHVLTVTLGYSSAFLAGFVAAGVLLAGILTRRLDREALARASAGVYGIVCFALFFSFTGTMLGGIWADLSWGRFWGWDPKENGALMVVLWNALILHARWGGMVGSRGILLLAVAGNIVTAFSWFGVNMLGVGLHSYGFTDGAMGGLAAFVVANLFMIGLGCTGLFRLARFSPPLSSPHVTVR